MCAATCLALVPDTARAEFPSASWCLPSEGLTSGWCGDGGPATRALLSRPAAVSAWADGSFVVMDSGPTVRRGVRLAVVRRVAADGTITVAAGTGRAGSTGDGGPATAARVMSGAIATLPDGGFLLAERSAHRVRRVWPDGRITTVAGIGRAGFSGDGGPATAAQLAYPAGLAVTGDGGFLIADSANARVRRVASDGTISTVAGDGRRGVDGDWGPATAGSLRMPTDVLALPTGGFVILDEALTSVDYPLVRVVLPSGQIFTHLTLFNFVVCGCELEQPQMALVGPSLFVAVSTYVLRFERDETTTHMAGRPSCGYGGDGGAARKAAFSGITDIAAIPGGGFLVADGSNSRVRRVDAAGRVTTVAGGGGRPVPRPRAAARICSKPAIHDPLGGFKLLPSRSAPARSLTVALQSPKRGDVQFVVSRQGRRLFSRDVVIDRAKTTHTLSRSPGSGRYLVKAVIRADGQTGTDTLPVTVRR